MEAIMTVLTCLFLLLFSLTNGSKRKESVETDSVYKVSPEELKLGQEKMTPPVMTEEEEGSRQLPRQYRCSGCAAIAYQFQKQFSIAESRFKKGKRLPYSDVLEVAESVCEKKLKGYGLKSVKGEKFLSGEGLEHDKDMGIMEAGGKWEVRLKTLCGELIELYEEEEIYEQYVQRGDSNLAVTLCVHYCTPRERNELKNGRKEEL
ncbi:unnamed protein product [Candidula unifasciata]|uniref:DUF3456 domain-containing protein n=1 Tax=Candidula unifasciata TaxID=100452 RepID=A0A8S3ZBW5_9EUPU|nr:unnamed protein product [Candidula unifasciata]